VPCPRISLLQCFRCVLSEGCRVRNTLHHSRLFGGEFYPLIGEFHLHLWCKFDTVQELAELSGRARDGFKDWNLYIIHGSGRVLEDDISGQDTNNTSQLACDSGCRSGRWGRYYGNHNSLGFRRIASGLGFDTERVSRIVLIEE
jgi:hypothetical protein